MQRLFKIVQLLCLDRRGNIAILFGVTLAPLMLAVGIGIDYSRALLVRNQDQAALDAAVLAAVTVPSEQKITVATTLFNSNRGEVFGLSVTPSFAVNADGSVSGSASADVPTLFGALAHVPHISVSSTAKAAATAGTAYCVLALASGTQGITTNGAPKASLGCNIMSNGNATCHGHNLGAPIGGAHGTNSGCGVVQQSNLPKLDDIYSGLAAHIPADTCGGSYPQKPSKKKDPALPAANQWHGTYDLSGYKVVCGDQQLTANTTINAPTGAVLVIENGQLDLNGFTLKTTSGSGLTIVFAGANNANYQHIPSGGGTLDFAAPTSGVWSGIAIYQDPSLTINVDVSAAGNSPTWNLTGLVYLPHASVTFSGAVNKASNGSACFALVVDNLRINGTGSIANNSQCVAAGLTLPTTTSGSKLIN